MLLQYDLLHRVNYESTVQMKFDVHEEDIDLIEMIQPDLENGPWIAGGAPLQWLNNKPVGMHDIDVFFKSEEQQNKTIDRMNHVRWAFYSSFTTENAITLTQSNSIISTDPFKFENTNTRYQTRKRYNQTVQLIKKMYFESAEDVISQFDLSICQLVTDGNKLLCGPITLSDIKNKKMRFAKFNNYVLKRVIKYMCYGYELTEESKVLLRNNSLELLSDFSKTDEYDNGL